MAGQLMMSLFRNFLLVAGLLFLGHSAHAQICSPNPNTLGVPFTDSCPPSAVGLNKAFNTATSHVANNTALLALARTTTFSPNFIRRDGFTTVGDGGEADYSFSSATCLGDNGSQVPALGGGCWLINKQAYYDVRIWGAVCDGVTDTTAASTAAQAFTSYVFFPANCKVSGAIQQSRITFPAVQSTDSATAAITTDSFDLGAYSQSGLSGNTIYRMTTSALVNNYDTVRSVGVNVAGSTVTNVTQFGAYQQNNNASASGVLYFGAGVAAVNGTSEWGLNPLLTDNTSYATSTGTGKTLYGGEYDFNNTSNSTNVVGALYSGASLAQPNLSIGIHFTPLNVTTKQFPWSIAYETDDAAATTAAQFGAAAVAAANVASQPVKWMYYDASSNLRNYNVQVNTIQELQFANQVFPGTFAFFGQIRLSAMTAPSTPPGGRFTIYMDSSDSKLHALGPSGTNTVLAVP